jgi:hypothetical protein
VDQLAVAKAAKVAVNTIRDMESRGADPMTSGAVTVRNVQIALESLGVEFLNGEQPGVRIRHALTPQSPQTTQEKRKPEGNDE